jgi:hypothetical protein
MKNHRLTATSVVFGICAIVVILIVLFGGKMPNITLPHFNGGR